MKLFRLYYIPVFILGVVMLMVNAGCRKDLGNYNYTKIDSVAISGIEDSYQVSRGTSTSIHPKLEFESGMSFVDDNFTYEWVYYNKNIISGNRTTLSVARNLDTVLPLQIGNYSFYYTIKQKQTGITWQKKFDVQVDGAFKKNGWFVMCDVSGQARVDYFEAAVGDWTSFPVVYRNFTSLIKDVNTGESMPVSGKPKSLAAFSTRDAVNISSLYWLYMNIGESTLKINVTNGFVWDKTRYQFSNETAFGEPAFVDYLEGGTSGVAGGYAFKGGDLYMYYYPYTFYGTPMNRVAGGARFNVAPWLAFPFNTNMHAVCYDTDNKRFMRTIGTATAAAVLEQAANAGTPAFNMGNVAKDIVWMGYTSFGSQLVAILKDSQSRYYMARITMDVSQVSVPCAAVELTEVTSQLTGIAQAEKFALNQQYGYLFYTVGSKLYQFDLGTKVSKMAKDYGSRKITMLKVNKPSLTTVPNFLTGSGGAMREPTVYSMLVGTYAENDPDHSGTVDFLKAPGLMADLTTYQPPFSGLGKVVDMVFMER